MNVALKAAQELIAMQCGKRDKATIDRIGFTECALTAELLAPFKALKKIHLVALKPALTNLEVLKAHAATLQMIDCSDNAIASLKGTAFPSVYRLIAANNKITLGDLSGIAATFPNLLSIDLSENPAAANHEALAAAVKKALPNIVVINGKDAKTGEEIEEADSDMEEGDEGMPPMGQEGMAFPEGMFGGSDEEVEESDEDAPALSKAVPAEARKRQREE
jgi:hypothetical protein